MEGLPSDLVNIILTNVNPESLIFTVPRVCKLWKQMTYNFLFWKDIIPNFEDFPMDRKCIIEYCWFKSLPQEIQHFVARCNQYFPGDYVRIQDAIEIPDYDQPPELDPDDPEFEPNFPNYMNDEVVLHCKNLVPLFDTDDWKSARNITIDQAIKLFQEVNVKYVGLMCNGEMKVYGKPKEVMEDGEFLFNECGLFHGDGTVVAFSDSNFWRKPENQERKFRIATVGQIKFWWLVEERNTPFRIWFLKNIAPQFPEEITYCDCRTPFTYEDAEQEWFNYRKKAKIDHSPVM